jgi:hypothetical protein
MATMVAALSLAMVLLERVMSAEPSDRPRIVVHYMPWFAAKPTSREWGWHWTMNTFDPEQESGGKRSIASHYYPWIGPYDSGDPAVIEYHLLLMKLAGIDGAIVDWYGLSDFLDYPVLHRNTCAFFEAAAKAGIKVGICYEDQTITKLVAAKRLPAEDRVQHARREMEWLRTTWFADPAYLRLNGRPVLLSFGSNGLTDAEWEEVFRPGDDVPVYLSEHRRRSVAQGAFDWPQPRLGLAGLDTYYQSIRDDRRGFSFSMPVAFPRFHDVYGEGKAQAGYARIPDDQGRTFAVTLGRALDSGAPLVQIATWNDWGEGTVVEPSREFGCRDLETVQRLRRARDPGFLAVPDDLRLPHRLWLLRGQQALRPHLKAELDDIARLLLSGDLSGARAALGRIESLAPRSD